MSEEFNLLFAQALLALAEGQHELAFTNYRALATLAASAMAQPPPRRQPREDPSSSGPGSGGSRAAASVASRAAPDSPLVEMVLLVRDRLGHALVQDLGRPGVCEDVACAAWRMCALIGCEAGTRMYQQRMCTQFADAAKAFVQTVVTSQAFRSAVQQPAGVSASASATTAYTGQEHVYVSVIADVLNLALEWFEDVMAEGLEDGTPLPNRCRSAAVVDLHEKCTSIAGPLLEAYLSAMSVSDVVGRVLDLSHSGAYDLHGSVSAAPVPVAAHSSDVGGTWLEAVAAASGKRAVWSPPGGTPSSSSAAAGAGAGAGVHSGVGSSGPDSTGSKREGGAGGVSREQLPSEDDVLMGGANQLAEQLSFLCGILERYLRGVSVALLLGVEEEGSQLRCPLTSKMQEMIGHYVVLERGFLQWSFKKAVTGACRIPMEGALEVFSFGDDVMFISRKALQRACATQSQLAVSATLNNVHAVLEDFVDTTLKQCVTVAAYTTSGMYANSRDAAEAELNAALSGMLMSADSPSVPPLTSAAAALNTLATVQDFATLLLAGMRDMVASTFPTTAPALAPLLAEYDSLCNRIASRLTVAASALANSLHITAALPLREAMRKCSLLLSPEEFDRLSRVDPVSECVAACVRDCAPEALVSRLMPACIRVFASASASLVTAAMEASVMAKQLNELGGLRVHALGLAAFDGLCARCPSASLRGPFARWNQCVRLWRAVSLADVRTLACPTPLLTGGEVLAALRCRCDLGAAAVDALDVTTLACVKQE